MLAGPLLFFAPSPAFAQQEEALENEGEAEGEGADSSTPEAALPSDTEPASPSPGVDEGGVDDGGVDDRGASELSEEDVEADVSATVDADSSGGGSLFESATAGGQSSLSTAGGVTLDWNGYIRGDVFIGVLPNATDHPAINAAYGEVSLQPKATAGSWGAAFADLRLRYGQQLDSTGLIVDLREAFTSAYLGPVELRLGKQVVAWGRADAFNPTSNIAPVDFRIRSPVEDDRRMGTVGARAFLTFNPVRIEGVWMPIYEPTILPPLQLEPYVRFVDPYYPGRSLQTGLLAAKVNLELSAFEASVSYLQGYAPLPGIEAVGYRIDGAVPNEVSVRRRAYKHHVFGADFAATPGGLFGIRGEAAFRLPFYYEQQPWSARPDLQWVVGLDKEFGPVMIIAQYLGKYTVDWQPRAEFDSMGSTFADLGPMQGFFAEQAITATLQNVNRMLFNQLYRFQTLFSGRVEWKTLHDSLSLAVLGLYNINTTEWLVAPKIGYNITGGLTAYVGAEIFRGPDDEDNTTLFGLIQNTLSSGYAELRFSF